VVVPGHDCESDQPCNDQEVDQAAGPVSAIPLVDGPISTLHLQLDFPLIIYVHYYIKIF